MKPLLWIIPAAFAMILAAGCDSSTRTRTDASVQSVSLTFSFGNAAFVGAVASSQYTVPQITRSVVDHGAVLLFFREQGTWTALPYTFGIESEEIPAVDYTVSMGYGFEHRLIEVFVELSTDEVWDDVLTIVPSEYQMKAVIIDEAVTARKNGVDLTNYYAVRDYYGLTD